MSFNSILNTVISSLDEDQTMLQQLFGDMQGLVIETSDGLDPQPTNEIINDVVCWTLKNSSYMESGEYVRVFQLSDDPTLCARLSNITVVQPSGGTPVVSASYRESVAAIDDPLPVFVTVPSVADLDGVALNAFELRSTAAFEVTAAVSPCMLFTYPCTGAPIIIPAEVGKTYRLRFFGFGNTGGAILAAYGYYWGGAWQRTWSGYYVTTFIDGTPAAFSAPPTTVEPYESVLDYTAINNQIEIKMQDGAPHDNGGEINVEVTEL